MQLTPVKISETSFLPQNQKPSNSDVQDDCSGTRPPDHGVPDEVHLLVVFDPEVLTISHVGSRLSHSRYHVA